MFPERGGIGRDQGWRTDLLKDRCRVIASVPADEPCLGFVVFALVNANLSLAKVSPGGLACRHAT